ncbi:signal recognition particle protein [SAR202 cluster bacterium AC-409-J13_OGT_754m]|nr:signal recognition particle protein [SAR202 cluster bacterium AC-409-J13_OGT_754m]
MFESLTQRLNNAFKMLTSKGRLTTDDIDEALRHVRIALLEADVHFKVVKEFISVIRERAVDQEVLKSLTPGQQVIKIVHEELILLLSSSYEAKQSNAIPKVLMLVGLQGSGKTTTVAKLGLNLHSQGRSVMLIAADLQRAAAVRQLTSMGSQAGITVFSDEEAKNTRTVVRSGIIEAKTSGVEYVIVDTAGRIHADKEMMDELKEICHELIPDRIFLVLDAMMGQDAVRSAEEFQDYVPITDLILTKMDGDARGGAALSATKVTGLPISYVGVGEKLGDLEPFYPDRMASRILGMGDVLTFIEKAQQITNESNIKELEKKIRKASFDFEDFLSQIQSLKKVGSIGQFMEMIPGISQLSKRLPDESLDDKEFKRMEAMIQSMTSTERRNPGIINGKRRRRIAYGSGTTIQNVNQLINKFSQAQIMMKKLTKNKGIKGLSNLFGG